jgi:hypothetical protein
MQGKNGIWRPKKELEGPIHACARANGHAVCVYMTLLGTTEGLSQNSAILVLLHEYVLFLGAYTMGI